MEQERRIRNLDEMAKCTVGKYGGFSFAGHHPVGLSVHDPLPTGTEFPNGSKTALLLTFDVEGTYGNGVGEMGREIANYERICAYLVNKGLTATFHVLGQMAEEQGAKFVEWMLGAGCEIATHGNIHDLDKLYLGERVFAGQYGPEENLSQIRDGRDALHAICPGVVRGARLPYGHFNEYTYDAIEACGMTWASNVGGDDMFYPDQGYGFAPFQIGLGEKKYSIVEIPLDSQTFDWPIWVADMDAHPQMVGAVEKYCEKSGIPFERTPTGGALIWQRRMQDAVENQSVFTFLCHPINLTVADDRWEDPVEEFMFPVLDALSDLEHSKQAWICTCSQLANFYSQYWNQ